ncbi:unannotated protein [freshwater metagenome]|uniref:Unannotated protein n=1 Tax=freshwater metagenome TaxID=449393 RepID=A0A6J7DAL8_9ZZZZ
MDTVAMLDVVKGTYVPWPRIESDDYLMTTGSARPLEDAFRIAHQQMVLWVAELTGQSVIDAYQLVSQAALTPIANVVDTAYTVVCKFPKNLLKGAVAMGGMHAAMRKAASTWRA